MRHPENFFKRSQDLVNCYHDAGQFYWGRANAWMFAKHLFEGSTMLLLPRWRVLDIDTEEDWMRAEFMQKLLKVSNYDL